MLRKETCRLRVFYPEKLSLKKKKEIQTFPGKEKRRKFIANTTAVREMPEGVR